MYIQHEIVKMNPLFLPIWGPGDEKNQAYNRAGQTIMFNLIRTHGINILKMPQNIPLTLRLENASKYASIACNTKLRNRHRRNSHQTHSWS